MKKLVVMGLAGLLCLSFVACSKSEGGSKQPSAADVVKAVAEQVTFKDAMTEGDDAMFSARYNLDSELVEDKAMYVGTLATAEEITVIKVKDAGDVQAAKDAVNAHLEDQKTAFENYIPEEMPKIENALVLTQGNYVLLAVADDTSKVKETFEAQF